MEWKLFDGDVAPFTDVDFYSDRAVAHHIDEQHHVDRLRCAASFVRHAFWLLETPEFTPTVSDMGCGDGGLLQFLRDEYGITGYGYDMHPPAVEYANDVRKVYVKYTDFGADNDIVYGDIVVMTEVLEHITDPHAALRALPDHVGFLVASSPWDESAAWHYEFHNWAWDNEGYAALIEQAGFKVLRHQNVGSSQIVLATRA